MGCQITINSLFLILIARIYIYRTKKMISQIMKYTEYVRTKQKYTGRVHNISIKDYF